MPEIKSQTEVLSLVKTGLSGRKTQIQQALPPGGIEAERFSQIAMMLFERTPQLLTCTRESLIGAVVEAAKLGLSLDSTLGQAYLIPYNDRKKNITRAVLIPGYRGLTELAMRSGQVHAVWAEVVREGDLCEERQGTDPGLLHKAPPIFERNDAYLDKNKIQGAYACARLANGMTVHCLMSKAEIEAIRQQSPGRNSTPWLQHYAEMSKKTPVRRLCKMLPLSPVDMRAVMADEYFDSGIRPEPTQVEYEEASANEVERHLDKEVEAMALGDGAPPPADEPFELGGPITPRTFTELKDTFKTLHMTGDEIAEVCNVTAGVDEPLHLSEDQAHAVMKKLGVEGPPAVESGEASSLFD